MENDLVNSVQRATELLDRLYGDSDHLNWVYLRYANTKDRLETTNKKSLYIAVMFILLMSGLVSNLRMLFRFSTRLWLGLLAGIVIVGIAIGMYSAKRGKKHSEIEHEDAKEEYERVVRPFLGQISASPDLELIPKKYQFPIAAAYILDALKNGAQTIDEAVQQFEAYYDELAGRSDHTEFRKTKEQAMSVRMFYPDLEIEEKAERVAKAA